MVVSIGWFQIIAEKMVGNHQTSIKNWLFRVPGYVLPHRGSTGQSSRASHFKRAKLASGSKKSCSSWSCSVARGAYKQQKNEEITWMKYAYTQLYTRPKVGPLVPEIRNSRATNLIEKKTYQIVHQQLHKASFLVVLISICLCGVWSW